MAQEKIKLSAGQTARIESQSASIRHDLLFPTGDFTPFTLNSFFGTYRSRSNPGPAATALFDLTATK